MKFKLTFLVLLITMSMLAQDNWQTHKQDNYSINHPEDWTYSNQKPGPNIQFVLKASESSAKNDKFQENINLNTESLDPKNTSLDDYLNATLNQIKSQIPNANIIENKSIVVNGVKAKSFIWSADIGNGTTLQFKQIIIIKDDTAYILTLTCTEAEYEQYSDVGSKILNTFKFNN